MPATINPLAESMTKVTGIDPLSETAGTSPITYGDDAGFRQPQGDVITISGDPGTGATTAETWGHELELAQQEFEALQFEYAQQQDLLSQQLSQQQLALDQQAAALQQSQYGLSAASAAREAQMQPYSVQGAALANEAAALANAEARRKEQQYFDAMNTVAYNSGYNSWLGGAATTPQSTAAYQNVATSGWSPSTRQSTSAYYGVPAGTNPYTGTYQEPTQWQKSQGGKYYSGY